jgi:hypothetical protein
VYAVGSCIVVAGIGYFLIQHFSASVHDRDLEAAITSALVAGSVVAVVAFVIGFVRNGAGRFVTMAMQMLAPGRARRRASQPDPARRRQLHGIQRLRPITLCPRERSLQCTCP